MTSSMSPAPRHDLPYTVETWRKGLVFRWAVYQAIADESHRPTTLTGWAFTRRGAERKAAHGMRP